MIRDIVDHERLNLPFPGHLISRVQLPILLQRLSAMNKYLPHITGKNLTRFVS